MEFQLSYFNKTGGGGKISFRIKSQTCQRHSEGANQTLCAPGPRDPTRLSQTCLWVFECLLWRHMSAVTCHGDRGSGCSRSRKKSVWHKSSWKRSPLAPPGSQQADDSQTGEQLYQRRSCTAGKVLGPTTDFPTWGSGKETGNPQCIWLWRSAGFDYHSYHLGNPKGFGKLEEGHVYICICFINHNITN